jgi:hypothetical protein
MSPQARPSRIAIVVAGLAGLLAGCSGGSAETPPVATLQSAAAPATGSSQATDRRPVFPVDATAEDKKAMAKPWVDCLVENAGARFKDSAEELIGKGGISADDPKGKAALQTCLPKQPETFDEHQLRTDLTAYKDNLHEWYVCARAAGYKLTAPDPETGRFGITEVGPNGDFGSPAMEECKRKAFTG